jgi:hypothetical protein
MEGFISANESRQNTPRDAAMCMGALSGCAQGIMGRGHAAEMADLLKEEAMQKTMEALDAPHFSSELLLADEPSINHKAFYLEIGALHGKLFLFQ